MDGFYYLKNGEYLERVEQESGHLSLLGKASDFEVMEQVIHKGKEFCVYPGENDKLVEFFYILQGKVIENSSGLVMTTGDLFYLNKLIEPVYFIVEEELRLLYVINDSLFVMLSDSIAKLKEKIAVIEGKDIYTEKHSERVMDYTYELAKRMDGYHINMMELVYASWFHDLGKIDIPDEILLKPAKLTKEEYEAIKKHPEFGKKIVEEISFMKIGEIIEQHHERLDGSGYPNGLKGDEIRVEAKIIAVVDSYDAMISDRTYRKGMSKEAAIAELEKYRDIHYEGFILDEFIDILDEEQ